MLMQKCKTHMPKQGPDPDDNLGERAPNPDEIPPPQALGLDDNLAAAS